jgi:protein gp37
MPLNKSSGNLYEFISHSWNPIKGLCPYQCTYCYVKRMFKKYGKEQGTLHLDEKELRVNLGNGNYIFVCSGCDLFHPDVPWEWIANVIAAARDNPQNDFLWHTKNPARALEIPVWQFPPKSTLCVTIESNIPWPGISKAPYPSERIDALKEWCGKKMITAEPVMDFSVMTFSEMILSCAPDQVNIGADSGNNHLPEPSPEKIAALIGALRENNIEVHLKKNLKRLYKE